MEFSMRILISGMIILIAIVIIVLTLSSLTGSGTDAFGSMADFFQNFATALS